MTVIMCVNACNEGPGYYAYAGLENGSNCFCGNVTTAGSTKAPDDDCNTPCGGDKSEICGGNNRLSLYNNGRPRQPDPTVVKDAGEWSFKGCYGQSNDAKTLTVPTDLSYRYLKINVENCLDWCNNLGGYAYAGVVVGVECWCDNNINPMSLPIDLGLCEVLACSGNSLEYCGGAQSIIVYHRGR